MTLIDKAEALLPCPFCGGGAEQDYQQPYRSISVGKLGKACTIYCTECSANVILCHEDHPGVSPDDLMAELVAAWNRRALPARGVGVRKLEWEESVKGRWIGTPVVKLGDLAFWIFQVDGGFRLAAKDGWQYHLTLEAAKAAAQRDYEARILAALEPTDAAHVNETPKSEHDGADVLTAAQARETALKKAAQLAYEVWDDPEALAKAILAMINEART